MYTHSDYTPSAQHAIPHTKENQHTRNSTYVVSLVPRSSHNEKEEGGSGDYSTTSHFGLHIADRGSPCAHG